MTFSNRPAPLPFFKTDFPLFLAPMAGVTDPIFRTICKELGVDVMVTEFVSAEGILQAWERNRRYTKIENAHRPIGIQLFGADGNHMGEAARIILDHEKPDFIDINFGCPVPKVVGKNGGSSLLKDLPLLASVAGGVVKAVGERIPVTAKIRIGWDFQSLCAMDACRLLENEGISMITIHGRTRSQQYSGTANWDIIDECARAMSVPVIGNGDISTPQAVAYVKENTAVSGVMIGRAAMENPWIFGDAKYYLLHGTMPPAGKGGPDFAACPDGPGIPPLWGRTSHHAPYEVTNPGLYEGISRRQGNAFPPGAGIQHAGAGRPAFQAPPPEALSTGKIPLSGRFRRV